MQKPNPNAETIEQMLRVDHAGEYGANRIYEGQLMVLGKSELAPTLKHMLEQEQEHLKKFDQLLNDNKVRPSVLMPLWHVAGLALGVGSALLGKKAAMACTVAVEEVIEEHYNSQIALVKDEELKKTITKFRDEEVQHRDTGIENKAKEMAGYALFSNFIKLGAKASIFLAKKFSFLLIAGLIAGAIFSSANAAQLDEAQAALRKGQFVVAYNMIQPLAVKGEPEAQFTLCGMFFEAQGVPKNDYEASRWCHAAAQNNHIEAMYNLALMYQNGEGVGQNFTEAKRWYSMAAERGHTGAQFNLAELNGTNNRVAQQLAQSLATSPALAVMAMQNPGSMPPSPQGMPMPQPPQQMAMAQPPQPPQQIMMPAPPQAPAPQQLASDITATVPAPQVMSMPMPPQFAMAAPAPAKPMAQAPVQMASAAPAQIPVQRAAKKLPKGTIDIIEPASGNIVRTVPDVEQPILIVDNPNFVDPYEACEIAKARGQNFEICNKDAVKKPAPLALATRPHSFAVESDANFSTALEAAKKGDTEAMNTLGSMYMTGNGVGKNYSEAMKWLEKSASKGNSKAMMNLAAMYRDGNGVLPNGELAYSWFNLAADRSKTVEDKDYASQNVQQLSKQLSNEQIGNALQYVTKLDEKIPQI